MDVVWNSVYFTLLNNPPISLHELSNTAPLWLNEGTPGGAVFTWATAPSGVTVWWTKLYSTQTHVEGPWRFSSVSVFSRLFFGHEHWFKFLFLSYDPNVAFMQMENDYKVD